MTRQKQRTRKIVKPIVAVLILVGLIMLLIGMKKILIKVNYPEKYTNYVEKYAKEYEIEKELIYAIIKAESNFKEDAISKKEAMGLMQILESTAKDVAKNIDLEISKEKLLEPEININLGTKYLSLLIEKYNNLELALAAYNAGIGNVDRWINDGIIKKDGTDIEKIPYKETNNYVRKVMRNYKVYKVGI